MIHLLFIQGKCNKVNIVKCTDDNKAEIIKTSANVIDYPDSPGVIGSSEETSDCPGSEQNNNAQSFRAPGSSTGRVAPSNIDLGATTIHLEGNERGWSAALWTIGFLIVGIIAKKVLVRAGVDIWSFID